MERELPIPSMTTPLLSPTAMALRRYAYSPTWFTLTAAVEVLAPSDDAASMAKLTQLWNTLMTGAERQKLFGRRHSEQAVLALLQQALSYTRRSGRHLSEFRQAFPAWHHGIVPEHAALLLADASFRDGRVGIGVWVPGKRVKLQIASESGSSAEAEVLAVQYAVETGCALGLTHFRVLTDCSFVLQALHQNDDVAERVRRAIACARVGGVAIEKAPRPFLARADALAYGALYLSHQALRE